MNVSLGHIRLAQMKGEMSLSVWRICARDRKQRRWVWVWWDLCFESPLQLTI